MREKWQGKNKEINWKKIYCIVGIILFLYIIMIIVDIMVNTELVLFTNSNSQEKLIRKIYNIEQNKNYEFEFSIESKTYKETGETFKIFVKQYNKNEEEIEAEYISFDEYEGKKRISINTTSDTQYISILFRCTNLTNSKYLKIEECKMNGKTIPLDYRLFPYSIIERLQNISMNSKSIYERFIFIKDAGKLIKDNWIFGLGENAWKYLYKTVRSEEYGAVQLHSYPANLWLQFGILSILIYIYLLIKLIKRAIQMIKEKDTSKLGIILSIGIIFIHSFLDFDMDFVSILFITFILIAILDKYEKESFNVKITKIKATILIIISTFLILINGGKYIALKLNKIDKNDLSTEERINIAKIKKYLSPFQYTYKVEYANELISYRVLNREEIDTQKYKNRIKEAIQNLEYAINTEPLKEQYNLHTSLGNCYLEDMQQEGNDSMQKFEELYENYVLNLDNIRIQMVMQESFLTTLNYYKTEKEEIQNLYNKIQNDYINLEKIREMQNEKEYFNSYSEIN